MPLFCDEQYFSLSTSLVRTSGFLTSTGVVGKLRYPRRTGEPGNIVMMYVFHENADAFAHKLNQMGFMKDAKAVWQDGDFDDNSGVRVKITF